MDYTNRTRLFIRVLIVYIVSLLAVGSMIFIPAGSLKFSNGHRQVAQSPFPSRLVASSPCRLVAQSPCRLIALSPPRPLAQSPHLSLNLEFTGIFLLYLIHERNRVRSPATNGALSKSLMSRIKPKT